jgi:hypothetical protein
MLEDGIDTLFTLSMRSNSLSSNWSFAPILALRVDATPEDVGTMLRDLRHNKQYHPVWCSG